MTCREPGTITVILNKIKMKDKLTKSEATSVQCEEVSWTTWLTLWFNAKTKLS